LLFVSFLVIVFSVRVFLKIVWNFEII
jgi:hypothetical protein